METLLKLTAVFTVFIIFLAWFTKAYSAFFYKLMVSDKLSIINKLIEYETVPREWRIKWIERMAANGEDKQNDRIDRLLKQYYIWKLKKAISSLRSNTIVGNEIKNQQLVILEELLEEWRNASSVRELIE